MKQLTNAAGFPKPAELIEITGASALEAQDRAVLNILYQHAHDSGRLADVLADWPELTNWASGTHKRTKLERISGSLSAEQALTAFQPARVAGAVMTGIISFPHILNRNQIDLENPALEPVAQSRAAMKIFSI